MLANELERLVADTMARKCETQNLELKAAERGCPRRLYDSLSSFSNQDDGGVILFGIDESTGFSLVGVPDAQDLQKGVMEQCEQMTPVVRPVLRWRKSRGKSLSLRRFPHAMSSTAPASIPARVA